MRYSHGSGGLVAPLHTAMLAECYVGASVDQRLVGVVVVREQALLELALVMEDCLEGDKEKDSVHFNPVLKDRRFVVWGYDGRTLKSPFKIFWAMHKNIKLNLDLAHSSGDNELTFCWEFSLCSLPAAPSALKGILSNSKIAINLDLV